MKKLFNVFTFIIIGTVFLTVIASSVTNYRYNTNGWDADTRETIRGSGVTYSELFSANLTTNPRFNTNNISEWVNIGGANLSYDISERMLQVTTQTIVYPYSENTDIGNLVIGNVYYARYDYFTTHNKFKEVVMIFGSSPSVIYKNVVINQTDFTSAVISANTGTFKIQMTTEDTLAPYSMYIDNIYLINLTEVYGAGNEPTATQIDEWYQDWNNLVAKPLDNLKTIDGMVDLFPLVFTIIIIAGSIMFIKSKQE